MPPYGAILRFGANQCTLAALVLKVGPAASCWIAPKADILGLRSLKANAARITIHLSRVMGLSDRDGSHVRVDGRVDGRVESCSGCLWPRDPFGNRNGSTVLRRMS